MNSNRAIDILVVGNLASHDLVIAEHLSRRGLRTQVFRDWKWRLPETEVTPLHQLHGEDPESRIHWGNAGAEFISLAHRARLIFSLSGSLAKVLGFWWPLRRFLRLPPVVNLATGSDITELIADRGWRGWLYRQHLRFVDLNWCPPYPQALKQLVAHRVTNVAFLRYPHYVLDAAAVIPPPGGAELRFLHCSHLDWKVNDPGTARVSAKGNDRFLRAFVRACREGLSARCVILDRGPDRLEARRLVAGLGAEEYFIWTPALSRDALIAEIQRADVVVDQFDVGGLGGIAVEAMSLARPVLVYLNENALRVQYAQLPPVLNGASEVEIHTLLGRCRDRGWLNQLGQAARRWAIEHHHWSTCLDQFLFYYMLLTGHQVVDYGWDRRPGMESAVQGLESGNVRHAP